MCPGCVRLVRFAGGSESAPTVVAGGLRWRERARRHEGMPPYVPANDTRRAGCPHPAAKFTPAPPYTLPANGSAAKTTR